MTPSATSDRRGRGAVPVTLDVVTEMLRSPALVAVVVGEILFWVLLAAGLAARYLLGRPRLGAVLLTGTILVDLGILAAAVLDLRSGGMPSTAHGLAALYVGVSLAFGPVIIRWADVRAAHRWAGGPAPVPLPRSGPARARHEWDRFARWLVAAAIAAAALGLAIVLGGPGATGLVSWFGTLGLISVIWFVSGPAWSGLPGRRAKTRDETAEPAEAPSGRGNG